MNCGEIVHDLTWTQEDDETMRLTVVSGDCGWSWRRVGRLEWAKP